MAAELIFILTSLAYLAASGVFFAHLVGRAPVERPARSGPWILAGAAVLHATYICIASLVENVCPVESIHFGASVAALAATVVYLLLRRRAKIDALGAFVAPLALTFVLASRFVGIPERHEGGGFVALHVTVNVLGDALFLLASASAALYLVQEKRLKQKRAAGLFGRLPPLDALDRAEHRFLLTGFPLLTLGIVTGTVWAGRVESGTSADLARAIFAYLTWVLFAGVLVLRAVAGWRGKRAAYGTIAGFVFAVAVLVVYLVRGAGGGAS